ncbi:(S)-ureidoglycine aminohydrolase [Pandoraea horticolens]|uniref:(S)-ureidoglycine aminohydrolase n=1 Tax=Pandoraea horticolens TaxID=2508298 RepID=A0A5E4X9S7_9BURK|nr:(S)-ureidoglycine aminohydrolase [Pandoraea horticolens]
MTIEGHANKLPPGGYAFIPPATDWQLRNHGESTARFVDIQDMRHDMHVNIVTFQPGGVIPLAETHMNLALGAQPK